MKKGESEKNGGSKNRKKEKQEKRKGKGKREEKKMRSLIHVSGFATEKKREKTTKTERTEKPKKIRGEGGGCGKGVRVGGRLPPGAEGDGCPC